MIDNVVCEVDNSNVCRSKQGQKKKLHYGELEGTTECITLQMTCRKDSVIITKWSCMLCGGPF